MNKSVIFLVVLIVLGLGVIFVFSSNNDSTPSGAESDTEKTVAGESFEFTGTPFVISSGTSTVVWEGSKKLVPNYKDLGTLEIKEGRFFVDGDILLGGVAVFDMNSIKVSSTGILANENLLERHLKSDDFFFVENYPTAEILISKAEVTSEGQYQLSGTMTIKEIAQEVSFPASVSIGENEILIEGRASFDRTLWDIRYGSDKFFDNLANNVIDDLFTVEFKIVANK